MPIEFKHEPEQNILIINIIGTLDWEQLKSTATTLMTSEQFNQDIDTLYDLREMDFSNITTEFEERLIQFRKQLDRGNAKIACVVANEVGYGMGRMYEVLSQKLPQQVRVFKDISEAKHWLTEKQPAK